MLSLPVQPDSGLPESRAQCLFAVSRSGASDIHMLRVTFIIGVVHTFCRLTVDADRPAGMLQRADIRVAASLGKALTAGPVTVTGVTASHHDIPFTAAILLIIAAV